MASACLPFLFKAIKIDNDYYWDGGYIGNPAIFPLIYHSVNPDILIIHINPIFRDQVPKTKSEIINRMSEISFNSSLISEIRAISFVTKLLDDGWIKDEYANKMKRLYLHAIRADISMQSYSVASKLNVEWTFLNKLFDEGRRQASVWLENNFSKIGKQTTIDMNEYL